MSGLAEVQVLYASSQKEFNQRQSDRQEIDKLGKDASERRKWAGKQASASRMPWAPVLSSKGRGVGKAHLFLSGSRSSSLVPGKVCIQIN